MSTISNSAPPSAFDARLIEVDIVLSTQTFTFNQNYTIRAAGSKFANGNFNTCELQIFNLTPTVRQEIISLASPLLVAGYLPTNSTLSGTYKPVLLNLRAGRVSTGLFTLFAGNVITGDITQPPDIGLTFRALTNNIANSTILGYGFPGNTLLSAIATQIAEFSDLALDFEATDRTINNFVMNPVLGKNVDELNKIGGIRAGIDNNTLYVINAGATRKGANFVISEATGMVGIPQVTDVGTTVRVMLNSAIYIGGQVTIQSAVNLQANGTYTVIKMDYDIASREQPFWITLLCSASPLYQGTIS